MDVAEKTARETGAPRIPEELAILPGGDAVLFPSMVLPFELQGEKWIKLVDEALVGSKIVGLFALKHPPEPIARENLAVVGTAAVVARFLRMPDGKVHVLLQGIERVRITEFTLEEPYWKARVEVVPDQLEQTPEFEALARNVRSQFQKLVSESPNLPPELAVAALNIPDPAQLSYLVAIHLGLSLEERQQFLEETSVSARLRKITAYLQREMEMMELGKRIQNEIMEKRDKSQREYYLREQLRAIQKELGELDEKEGELTKLRERIESTGLTPEARKAVDEEMEHLARINPASAEYAVSRNYLDWLLGLPWQKSTSDSLDVALASQVLNEDHYDLEKPKERILEYLAVRKLRADAKGPILCFVGPPGVGKTSLGQSIARAMGRRFVRLSLGGVRDEAEIRGHRRTYVGALPGRIIRELRRAESNNPVFMLDEVDKIGADFRGDPASALLEVLDPAQNNTFVDHYLDVSFDLSRVMFITTANILDTIPPPLRDRMEILELPGYTESEKLGIARRYLLPRQHQENGLTAEDVSLGDEAILDIIRHYTREAGVRNLEREIANICRKVARKKAEGLVDRVEVSPADLKEYLGPARFRYEMAGEEDEIGVATGLAWTPTGGEVLFVEASLVPGHGELTLTGKLGDVMQESARAALTYTRSRAERLGIDPAFHEKTALHIHVPAGAIPKDGPSAGITIATAVVSALCRRPVRKQLAMTGEITLRGKVLPIGGVKEKILAAHRAGIKTVLLPQDNEKDLQEIPPQVREELRILFVKHMDEVLDHALISDGKPSS
ncbi:MAG: endopeptidase La [Candidatus Tectomicrobia bacterium]|uniref:Lon protease n=1 Tax=Tectimicrobiota bacterium TaxID=2528274 RepID=A0A932GP20_UNCTE|nr:endopeptidase La [Candidatus Tectomicrobia bacterium]